MGVPLKSVEGTGDIAASMRRLGAGAREAARILALAPAAQKDRALAAMAAALRARQSEILKANAEDVADAKAAGIKGALLDRLTLDKNGIDAMTAGIEVVRGLKDPVGTVMD